MLDKILDAAKAVFGFLNTILGWFKKPLEKKIGDAAKEIRDEIKAFKKSGRPRK